jgi:hypothetical protein
MKNILKAAIVMAGMAMGAQAQLNGLGWDNNWQEVQARLGLGANALDIGVGFTVDPENDDDDNNADGDDSFVMSVSALFLGHLHDWGPVDTYFAAGARFLNTDANDDMSVLGVVGFQPEVTLLDHIVVSTRFGLEIPLMPDFVIRTAGQEISIVNGFNFKILF